VLGLGTVRADPDAHRASGDVNLNRPAQQCVPVHSREADSQRAGVAGQEVDGPAPRVPAASGRFLRSPRLEVGGLLVAGEPAFDCVAIVAQRSLDVFAGAVGG